ncbi:MAG: hypothetical protein WC865_18700 [Bacteroidales bacterium]
MDIRKIRNPALVRLTGIKEHRASNHELSNRVLIPGKRQSEPPANVESGSFVPVKILGDPQIHTTDQRIELRLPDGIEIILTGTGSLSAVQSILSIL